MAERTEASTHAVFVFPSATGHVNPSLPVARRLTSLGWTVDFACRPQHKEAIEGTGAQFVDWASFTGKEGTVEAITASLAEYGDAGAKTWGFNFGSIGTLKLLPHFVKWLSERSPAVVVYCPVLCVVARLAAAHLNIPCVSLLTTAGPGYLDAAFKTHGGSAAAFVGHLKGNEPNNNAIRSLKAALPSMPELTLNTAEPLVFDYYASHNLVSTVASLADPMNEADAASYSAAGKTFTFVGPLLDVAGSKRSAGHLGFSDPADGAAAARAQQHDEASVAGERRVMEAVEAAVAGSRTAGSHRAIVYVSMGTVLTGDHPEYGWMSTAGSSLTGKQLCQAVYRAVFTVLGSVEEEDDERESGSTPPPLIVVSLGPMADALEGIDVPQNAICVKRVAQVDLLRIGKPMLFVSNGGQNSLTEGMMFGTPFVVCPGFGDQVANAARVGAQGLGLVVDRPKSPPKESEDGGEVDSAAAAYQAAVQRAISDVAIVGRDAYVLRARAIAAELEQAGGVETAATLVAQAAQEGK